LIGSAPLSTPMSRLRRRAATCGPAPVRIWEASSAGEKSRAWCRPYSIAQCRGWRAGAPVKHPVLRGLRGHWGQRARSRAAHALRCCMRRRRYEGTLRGQLGVVSLLWGWSGRLRVMTTLADDLVPDELWALVEPLLPAPPRPPDGGRHRTISDRACLAAIVYMARTSTPGGSCRPASWAAAHRRRAGAGSPGPTPACSTNSTFRSWTA
jgi:hypothetical protein